MVGNQVRLSAFDLCGTATAAAQSAYQFAAFYVERSLFYGYPLVKTTLAKGLAFVLFLQGLAFEVNDVAHRDS